MTLPVFPQLSGQSWTVHKKPLFSTLLASHTSGREVRAALWNYPLWEFELQFDALSSDNATPGLGNQSFQALLGLYLQCQGRYSTFLYTDPSDNTVIGQNLATGDGATNSFTFGRMFGSWFEPASYVTGVANVVLNGVTQNSGWGLALPNQLIFATPPASGTTISSSFSYAFVCRFMEDQVDFENFARNLWSMQSLKFISVRTS